MGFEKEVTSDWVLSGNIETCEGASFKCDVSDPGRGLRENTAVHLNQGLCSPLFTHYLVQLFPLSFQAAIMVHTNVLADVRKSING